MACANAVMIETCEGTRNEEPAGAASLTLVPGMTSSDVTFYENRNNFRERPYRTGSANGTGNIRRSHPYF